MKQVVRDDRIEQLGKYFVAFKVRRRTGITFEQFVHIVDMGRWDATAMDTMDVTLDIHRAIYTNEELKANKTNKESA